MSIVDVGIVFVLIFGFLLGFKRGFTEQLVKGLGFVAIVILAFFLKNPLSVILYENMPFFKFGGILKGVEVINIFLYEAIAFLIVLAILGLILKVVILASSIFEKVLKATIILSIPSKIAGGILGVLEYFVFIFLTLYILSMPIFNNSLLDDSKLRPTILSKTPILSSLVDDGVKVIDEFVVLKNKLKDNSISSNEFNEEAMDVMLKHKVVTISSVEKLIEKDKITDTVEIRKVIEKYKGENIWVYKNLII